MSASFQEQHANATSVLIVEDDPVARSRLTEAVGSHPQLHVAATAGNLADALIAFDTHLPRVVLTDLGLPDGSGLDLIRKVHEAGTNAESMVLSVFGDERHVVAALKAGAKGYLLKDSPFETIATNILLLIEGGSPINPKVARFLLGQFNQWEKEEPVQDKTVTLSEREREILGLISKGYKRAEIAGLLAISSNTVGTHIKRIYEKLSVHSNIEAAQEAAYLGLLDDGK